MNTLTRILKKILMKVIIILMTILELMTAKIPSFGWTPGARNCTLSVLN
jgi:hypothetical protein